MDLVKKATPKGEVYNKSYCEVAKSVESCSKELNINVQSQSFSLLQQIEEVNREERVYKMKSKSANFFWFRGKRR